MKVPNQLPSHADLVKEMKAAPRATLKWRLMKTLLAWERAARHYGMAQQYRRKHLETRKRAAA